MSEITKEKKEEVLFKDKKPEWHKISKRVSIVKNTEYEVDERFKPKDIQFEDNAKALEQVGIAISKNLSVLLIGETGTGKTSLVRHLACRTNNAFIRVNHNGGTTVEDLIGRWTLVGGETKWVDGLLVEAAKNGWWFLADEINASSAEINFVYHQLLDDDGRIVLVEKGNEVVVPHENFKFFAAMNPPTEYAGTKPLNKALMSRFIVVKVDFPDPKIEEKILVDRTKIEATVAQKMVQCAAEIRVNHQKEQIGFVFSTRDLLMWATMFKVYKKYLPSAEMTVLNKVSVDDLESIKDIMGIHFKTLDARGRAKVTVDGKEKEEEEELF